MIEQQQNSKTEQLERQVQQIQAEINQLQSRSTFNTMKWMKLVKKQESDLMFFRDQFNLKLEKIKGRGVNEQGKYELIEFYRSTQTEWDKKIRNLVAIIEKKHRMNIKKQMDRKEELQNRMNDQSKQWEEQIDQYQNVYQRKIEMLKERVQSKANKDGNIQEQEHQMHQMEWLATKIDEDIQDQNSKIESIRNINNQFSFQKEYQQIQQIKDQIIIMKNSIAKENGEHKIRQKQKEELEKQFKIIKEVKVNRQKIRNRLNYVQSQVMKLGDRMETIIRETDRKIAVDLEGRLDTITKDIEIITNIR